MTLKSEYQLYSQYSLKHKLIIIIIIIKNDPLSNLLII